MQRTFAKATWQTLASSKADGNSGGKNVEIFRCAEIKKQQATTLIVAHGRIGGFCACRRCEFMRNDLRLIVPQSGQFDSGEQLSLR